MLTKSKVTTDENNNQTTELIATYTYDTLNRLVKVTKGEKVYNNTYDNENRLIYSECLEYPEQTVLEYAMYCWDIDNVVMTESWKNEQCGLDLYVRGNELISKVDIYNSEEYEHLYYVQNPHGDVVRMMDASGNVVNSYTYDQFGAILEQTEGTYNPFKYAGELHDMPDNLIYLRNRIYDPKIGRFLTEDPIKDGTNWYVYCGNNPVNYWDPWGLKDVSLRNMVESLGGTVTPNMYSFLGVKWGLKSITVELNGISKRYTSRDYHITETEDEITNYGKDRAVIDDEIILNDFYGDIGDGTGNPNKQQAINYITRVSYENGIPVNLSLAVAWIESTMTQILNTAGRVDNGGGDYGIMQINKTAHPEAFTAKNGDIINNWHDNVDYGIEFLTKCYNTAKEKGMIGDDLYKGTYSKYNSGSIYNYQTSNHQAAKHVSNFWNNYTNCPWRDS